MAENQNTFKWMSTLLDPILYDVPLNQLIIPGSHDSGAYEFDLEKGIAVDRIDLNSSFWLKLMPYSMKFLRKFSQTQTLSIAEQLQIGIRYFDIRIGLNPDDKQYYIVHNLYGPNLLDVFEQIELFINDYPKEVFIIDVQHVWGINDYTQYKFLLELFHRKLEPYLIKRMSAIPPLKEFWARGKSIILIWRATIPEEIFDKLEVPLTIWYPGDKFLDSPWPNTTSYEVLLDFTKKSLENRSNDDGKFFVSQCVLTANSDYIIRHPLTNLKQLANQVLKLVPIFFKHDQDDSNLNSLTKNGNVFMFDFIDNQTTFEVENFGKTEQFNLVKLIVYINKWYADRLIKEHGDQPNW